MGCDCHPHLELKIQGDWHYIGRLIRHRNYLAFGYLSGVRYTPKKGSFFESGVQLPEDISEDCERVYKSWEGDAHNLTIIDFAGMEKFISERGDEYYGEAGDKSPKEEHLPFMWHSFMKKITNVKEVEDARIILWYDN